MLKRIRLLVCFLLLGMVLPALCEAQKPARRPAIGLVLAGGAL